MRPTDVMPQMLIDELVRLGKLDPDWVQFEELEANHYRARIRQPTWLRRLASGGTDAFAMHAGSTWLINGPKVFRPAPEQCAALEQIEVRLTLEEYAQPYPALLVALPRGQYGPFNSVLCHRHPRPYLIMTLNSDDHTNDICTTVARTDGNQIEVSIQRFDADLAELSQVAARVLRVACNSCLALAHYGNHLGYLFPKEVENDRRLAREQTERGERARRRLALAVQQVTFSQEITLHRTERRAWDGEPGCSGAQKSTHWRRGHWHTVPHGPGRSLRKKVLYPPVLVRADLFTGDLADTLTSYQTSKA